MFTSFFFFTMHTIYEEKKVHCNCKRFIGSGFCINLWPPNTSLKVTPIFLDDFLRYFSVLILTIYQSMPSWQRPFLHLHSFAVFIFIAAKKNITKYRVKIFDWTRLPITELKWIAELNNRWTDNILSVEFLLLFISINFSINFLFNSFHFFCSHFYWIFSNYLILRTAGICHKINGLNISRDV